MSRIRESMLKVKINAFLTVSHNTDIKLFTLGIFNMCVTRQRNSADHHYYCITSKVKINISTRILILNKIIRKTTMTGINIFTRK